MSSRLQSSGVLRVRSSILKTTITMRAAAAAGTATTMRMITRTAKAAVADMVTTITMITAKAMRQRTAATARADAAAVTRECVPYRLGVLDLTQFIIAGRQ